MSDYMHPEVLVETDWVQQHLNDTQMRLVESNEDALLYETGHIPGAAKIDWFTVLQHPTRRDFLSRSDFEKLCSTLGIANDTVVVFYGDKSNWFAVYAFWLFLYFGHENLRVMNGGRAKWVAEGRPLTNETTSHEPTQYRALTPNNTIRAFRDDVFRHLERKLPLVDVRSPKEFSGELLHMPGYPQEGAQRGGHIPGAVNIPWAQTVREDGTFKSADELHDLYRAQGIYPEKDIIAYCRIGERSSHSWFVLQFLLGYPSVKNYDGSWTEWGNLVGAPVEKGPGA
ncbi:MAG: sulfurtransferase [Chloroflexi bacterium HGW-Chloroflexi-10]|nr:MAG: sulfurtransferase [Chloroflexi bacterium HGW-Chloroflexi-10]